MRSSASTTSWSGTRCRPPRLRRGDERLDFCEVAQDPFALGVALAEVVRRSTGDALEDDVGRSAEQDDGIEALVERALVGDAAGDEERLVSVLVQQLADPVLAPERLGLALDPPAVIRVHDPVPTALELGEG